MAEELGGFEFFVSWGDEVGERGRIVGSRSIWFIAAFWSMGVAGGFVLILNRAFTPGEVGLTPSEWPAHVSLPLSESTQTLVMFAHPKCPCSAASLTELENALSQTPGRASVSIVFYEPAKGDSSWRETPTVRQAAKIPGARLVWDRNGRIAKAFGANTSGHVVLYDAEGGLKFSGGVTVMRGHLGPCQGQKSLRAAQEGESSLSLTSDVYGCTIRDGTSEADAP